MPTATFIGDPRGDENPPVCEMAELSFPLGEAVDVPNALAVKLMGNSHFRVEGLAVTAEQQPEPPKRRGRPPKVKPETEPGENDGVL